MRQTFRFDISLVLNVEMNKPKILVILMKMNFKATFFQLAYEVIYLVNCFRLEKSCLKIPFY